MGRHPRGRVLHVLRCFMMDEREFTENRRTARRRRRAAVRRPSSELPRSSRVPSRALCVCCTSTPSRRSEPACERSRSRPKSRHKVDARSRSHPTSHHSNAPADGRLPAGGRPHTVNSGNPDTLHTARPTRAVPDAPPLSLAIRIRIARSLPRDRRVHLRANVPGRPQRGDVRRGVGVKRGTPAGANAASTAPNQPRERRNGNDVPVPVPVPVPAVPGVPAVPVARLLRRHPRGRSVASSSLAHLQR